MAYEIKMLDLIDIELESSFLVLARNMGIRTRVKTWGYLILGSDTEPILVDTGASHPEIMETLGMTGIVTKEMTLRRQLTKHGVKINDVRWILHTHHHIDHAGQDSQFSMRQTVVTNRRELEYSASGNHGRPIPGRVRQAPHRSTAQARRAAVARPRAVRARRDRTRDCVRGRGRAYGGVDEHPRRDCRRRRPASAAMWSTTSRTRSIDPIYQVLDHEPQSTGNQGTSKRQERAAIKKALNSGTFLLPIHDYPARIEHGRVVVALHRRLRTGTGARRRAQDDRRDAEDGTRPGGVRPSSRTLSHRQPDPAASPDR